MCILCVIQKWSRKVATMLPWLVIPLIGLWLLSQFLPPAFRFEITSPRLACVLVLLITLFWYEILMPQLSSWRIRRNARLRERKRFEAIEMQKLRKTATRRCRNCLTPYRDQNPAGGKFMCSYCGHISKRPVLDLSIPPSLSRLSNSQLLKDLVGKGGKMLNGKVWSDNNWICGQDWLENGGNWVNGSLSGKSNYLKKNRGSFFNGGNDNFFSEKSYSFLVFIFKSLASIFLGIMWLWRKLFRINFNEDETSSETNIRGKKGENGISYNESRTEKARRKAEEKRQARLEREQLEEEERKQREEVARLVEERRKLRDEKSVTENNQRKTDKKEKQGTDKKRQEKKKEKDLGSSKSNSDVDEVEKRAIKDIEKNKKGENYRNNNKFVASNNNYNKGGVGVGVGVGARYLDRMRGNFFPSSRTFSGGGFFGEGKNANIISNTREHKSSAFLDNVQITVTKRDFVPPERAREKSSAYVEDQNHNRHGIFESQPNPAPKRSWQQLFTRSSTTSTTSSTSTKSIISRPIEKPQTSPQNSIAFDNPAFGLPYPPPSYPIQSSSTCIVEESDNFEDPCYVPDPTSLIGPVSEWLDDFHSDLGFVGCEVNKPSPIESPISRLRETDGNLFRFPTTQYEKTNLPLEDHGGDKGWQMWNSSPLGQDWYIPPEVNGSKSDPWAITSPYPRMNLNQGITQNEVVYGNPKIHQFPPSHANVWEKKEKGVRAVESIGNTSTIIAPGGGLYSTSDVQSSLWSYE